MVNKSVQTQPEEAPPALSALDVILEDLPSDTKSQILRLVVDANLTDKDDILYQIVAVLGIYASYFERTPGKIADEVNHRISELRESAERTQQTSDEGHRRLQEEGAALVGALQEFVVLTQSVKSETQHALERTSTHLKELSESFSREIKDKVVAKTLDELVAKVDSTLRDSEEILAAALERNRLSGEEITRTSSQLVDQSRKQLEAAHQFDSRKSRRLYAALGSLWGVSLGLIMGATSWWMSQHYYHSALSDQREQTAASQRTQWEEFTRDMTNNKAVLQKIGEAGIELRFVKNNGVPYLVVPGQVAGETESGIFIRIPGAEAPNP